MAKRARQHSRLLTLSAYQYTYHCSPEHRELRIVCSAASFGYRCICTIEAVPASRSLGSASTSIPVPIRRQAMLQMQAL